MCMYMYNIHMYMYIHMYNVHVYMHIVHDRERQVKNSETGVRRLHIYTMYVCTCTCTCMYISSDVSRVQ